MTQTGPNKISFPTFLLKILAGVGGGTIGTVILVVFFLVISSFMPMTDLQDGGYISPIFIFILMIMIFVSSTVGNILSTYLLSLTENDKYTRVSSAIYQVFIVSIIIFILMVPVYFIASSMNSAVVPYAIALHVIVSAQVSALILEIVSDYKYSLVGVYGITFSILISAAILFGLSSIIVNPAVLLFIALPVVWGSLAFTMSVVTMLYGWIANIYDSDFLCTKTLYGADYGKEVEDQEEDPKAKDEAGADFLKHN